MSESNSHPTGPGQPSPPDHRRLDSWKAIAVYLKRDVTTVRRWEKREGLPVHRHQHSALGSVYAFTDEIDAWQFGRDESPQSPAAPSLIRTPDRLVGREAELRRLHTHLEDALQGNRRTVFISGELGIGKTALAHAFLDSVSDVWVVTGQCVEQYGRAEPYLPVVEGLDRLIRDARNPEAIRILEAHARSWCDQRWFDGTRQRRRSRPLGRERHAESMEGELIAGLEALAAAKPLVVLLEDLHWSDPSTVELIARLGRRPERARLLLIGTYRLAELVDSGSPLLRVGLELRAHFQADEIELPLLDRQAIAQFIAHNRQWTDVQAAAARLRQWSGNPLFLGHLVEHLERTGSLREQNGAWALDLETIEPRFMPTTLRTLMEDQVDRLDPDTRRFLEIASVSGDPFPAAVVARAALVDVTAVERSFEALCRRSHLVARRGVAQMPDGTRSTSYGFIHEFYRQVVYDRLPSATSSGLHQEIGARLEAAYGHQILEIASELAAHFDRGHDPRRAVRHYARAAENALLRHADREAELALRRAAELLVQLPPDGDRERMELQLRTQFDAIFRRMAEKIPWITMSNRTGPASRAHVDGDSPALLDLLVRLSWIHSLSGDLQAANESADQAVAMGRVEREGLFGAGVQRAFVRSLAGEFVTSRIAALDALAIADRHHVPPSSPGRAQCQAVLAWSAWCLGRYEESSQTLEPVLSAVDGETRITTATWAAALLEWLGDARGTLIDVSHLGDFRSQSVDAPWSAEAVHGWLLLHRQREREGLEILDESARTLRRLGLLSALPQTLAWLAEGLQRTGQSEESRTAAEEGLDVIRRTGVRSCDPELYRLRGESILATKPGAQRVPQSDRDAAEASFWAAITVARQQEAMTLELRATASLAGLLLNSGRQEEARQILAPICEAFPPTISSPDLAQVRRLLRASG